MAGKDGDDGDDSLWTKQLLNSLQKEHDKFFDGLRTEGKRLKRELSSHRSTGTGTGPGSSSNPFASFKQFVDDSFDSITSGITYFPSKFAEWGTKMQQEQERRRNERQDISTRWTGSTDSPDHVLMEVQRSTNEEKEQAFRAATSLVLEAHRKNARVPLDKIQALYREPEAAIKVYGHIQWLSTRWFKEDPYSPIRLEAQPELAPYGPLWRAAFEDLMDASLDKPMTTKEAFGVRVPYGKPQSTLYGPGLEWMLSMQCRGILPPQVPKWYSRSIHQECQLNSLLWPQLLQLKEDPAGGKMQCDFGLVCDLGALASEVGTRATTATGVEMREGLETEQDLYEALMATIDAEPTKDDAASSSSHAKNSQQSPEYQTSERASQYADASTQCEDDAVSHSTTMQPNQISGDKDLRFAEQKLWDALDARDVGAAKNVIDDWHDKYLTYAGGLFYDELRDAYERSPSAPAPDWLPIWNAAVSLSKLPESDKYRNLLDQRYARLTGKVACWDWSNEQIEQKIGRLQEELENMDEMTGGGKKQIPAVERKVDVLSALTTSHTVRLSDGTVTTKVVLKQRFADGREETTERVHTTNENTEQQSSHARREDTEQQKSKGWFWS